jgi:hypothetical protein
MHVVEMDDEELYVLDDVLEEASAVRYQMLLKKSKLSERIIGKIYTITREWKSVSEKQWAKNDEVKWTKEKPSPTGNHG